MYEEYRVKLKNIKSLLYIKKNRLRSGKKKILVELFGNLYFKTFEKNIWHKSFTTTQSIRSIRSATFQNGSLSFKTEGLEPIWDHRLDKAIAKRTRTAFCRSSSKQVFLIILLKRDFYRVVFLWILRNFQEQLFFIEHLFWLLLENDRILQESS